MNRKLKTLLRDLLPKRYQVPVKFWYSRARGTQEKEIELLPLIVRKHCHVIDVGSNRGLYAYCFWKLGANIEIFEPNPKCNRVLSAWGADKPGVNIHTVALSDKPGKASLHIPFDETGEEHDASASIEHNKFTQSREQLVSLETLDSYQFYDVSFIKIDVEGHEHKVIEGAVGSISASRPALLVEIEQRHHTRPIQEVFEKILLLGYQGFYMDHDQLMGLESFDVGRHQSKSKFDEMKDRYINNFLFLNQSRLEKGEYVDLIRRCYPDAAMKFRTNSL